MLFVLFTCLFFPPFKAVVFYHSPPCPPQKTACVNTSTGVVLQQQKNMASIIADFSFPCWKMFYSFPLDGKVVAVWCWCRWWFHKFCPLHFSEKHVVLSPFTSVKQSKTTQLCPHHVPVFEGRRKTVKPQSCSYMIVCINTSCSSHWAAYGRHLNTVWLGLEIWLLL